MRISHYVFIAVFFAWVSVVTLTNAENISYAEKVGQAVGSFVIPSLIYLGYVLWTRKKEQPQHNT